MDFHTDIMDYLETILLIEDCGLIINKGTWLET